jgi:hypothetical protein
MGMGHTVMKRGVHCAAAGLSDASVWAEVSKFPSRQSDTLQRLRYGNRYDSNSLRVTLLSRSTG